jgi:hypothetical protein
MRKTGLNEGPCLADTRSGEDGGRQWGSFQNRRTRHQYWTASPAPDEIRRLEDADLVRLADELRRDTIAKVAATGGHLGSTLGVIELTVAIHAVFDTPRDKLIWDVGHQAYAHKILTGRREAMATACARMAVFPASPNAQKVNTTHSGPRIPRPRFPQGWDLPQRARFGYR